MPLNLLQAALAALDAAMDDVPLTAEQRHKIREEFADRCGIGSRPFLQPSGLGSNPISSATTSGKALMNVPLAMQGVAAAAINLPMDMSKGKTPPWTPPGSTGPKESMSESDIADRLEGILEYRIREHNQLGFVRGFFDAAFLGVGLGTATMATGLLLSAQPSLLILYAFETLLLITIVTMALYVFGTMHERLWGGLRSFGIVLTLLRGMIAPVSVPMGVFATLHEMLWGKAKNGTWKGRMLRSLVGPVSVPVGLAWDASEVFLRTVGLRRAA